MSPASPASRANPRGLPAYLLAGEPKYKTWIVDYMDAWLERMKQNGGIIPSFVDLDGRIGGPDGKWWNNAYGWGFSPVNPVTGKREDRNWIPRALVGFSNALLVIGAQKYVDAWRAMIDAVNSHTGDVDGRRQYPTMHGADGWYGWRNTRGMWARWRSGTGRRSRRIWRASQVTPAGLRFFRDGTRHIPSRYWNAI